MNLSILRVLLALLVAASSVLAQPVRISEPQLAERFVRQAPIATDAAGADLNPVTIYQSAVASWKGRTTAAWIESTATGDRLVVARIGAAGTTVLLERPLPPRSSNVALESGPEVDLVVWRIDRELHAMRFDASGAPIDSSPLWIGHTRSLNRPGIAWNGSSFLVVWGSSLINGARVPPSGGASYLGIIWVGTPDPSLPLTVESPSIAWNGSGYLMTYLGYQYGGVAILAPEPRRGLYYSILDANAAVVGSVPWRIPAPEVSAGHLTEWVGGRQSSPAPVRSDGGEYVVGHSSEIGAQLFRISASGSHVLGAETIDWWGRRTGHVDLDTAGEGEGYALAVLRPTESGSILILDRLDSSGTRTGASRAHRLEYQPVDLDVAMVAEGPLVVFGGNDGALTTASSEGSSSVPLPPTPPEVTIDGRGMVRWLPV
ncbi:MAG: hypothetical protein LC732_09545, partial [Acidobacteria bacterium]|nr:hypothetical protein [Acidobacteriota bacterium]